MLLWAAALAFAIIAAGRWDSPELPAQSSARSLLAARLEIRAPAADPVSAQFIAAHDPFRLERKPSAVSYGSDPESTPLPPTPPKPQLVLVGVLGGPPWQALIDGLPGRAGTAVVRQGDQIGELTIERIRSHSVRVSGLDTTWTLTVRRVW